MALTPHPARRYSVGASTALQSDRAGALGCFFQPSHSLQNVPNSQVDDIKRANGLFSNSFGLKTELKMPKRSGVAAVNEVLRVVRLPCVKLLQRELAAFDCQPIPLQAIAGDCE